MDPGGLRGWQLLRWGKEILPRGSPEISEKPSPAQALCSSGRGSLVNQKFSRRPLASPGVGAGVLVSVPGSRPPVSEEAEPPPLWA